MPEMGSMMDEIDKEPRQGRTLSTEERVLPVISKHAACRSLVADDSFKLSFHNLKA